MKNKNKDKAKSIKTIKLSIKFKGKNGFDTEGFGWGNGDFHGGENVSFSARSAKMARYSRSLRGALTSAAESANYSVKESVDFFAFPEFEPLSLDNITLKGGKRRKEEFPFIFGIGEEKKEDFSETTTMGTLSEYEDCYIISYDEYETFDYADFEETMRTVKVMIFKNNPDVIVVSNNDFENESLTFERNKMTIDACSDGGRGYEEIIGDDGEIYYIENQPFSEFFTVSTHSISSEIKELNGDLKLNYTIGHWGRILGVAEYSLKYKVMEV